MNNKDSKYKYQITATHHLEDILRRISVVPSKDNGQISWNSEPLDRGTFELIYSLKFKPKIEDHIKDGAIWHVLNECARAEKFSTRYFLQRLKVYLHDLDEKSPQVFIGIGQINFNMGGNHVKSLRSFDKKIEFISLLSAIDQSIVDKSESFDRQKLGLHDDFTYMVTRVRAVDHRSAIDRVERNFLFGLGILNLVYRGYGISRRFGYPNAPMGKFLSASSIFLIDRKTRGLGHYFSSTNYPVTFKQNFSAWRPVDNEGIDIADRYVSALKRVDYAEKVIQSIILFQEGLESLQTDGALLKFWTGIELLCSKEEKKESEKMLNVQVLFLIIQVTL